MSIISQHFNLSNINIVLIVFLIVIINIIITMKIDRRIRYGSFLVYSSYLLCTILISAVYLTFTWYLAILIGLLLADLTSKWVKKQLVIAAEEEKKGGFGLTKKIRLKQIENYILKASPVDLNKVKKFEENPIRLNKAMFMVASNAIAFLIAIAILVFL